MEDFATVQCPYCGQKFDLEIDSTSGNQRFMTECEVCCRPISVWAECEGGEILSVETSAE